MSRIDISEEMIRRLIAAAREGQKYSYSPYSGFKVGAAVLGTDGMIYTGCNIENVSYGLTNCAERTAIFKMVSSGCRTFKALALVCGEKPQDSAPCGACRQVMAEFVEDASAVPVIMAGNSGDYCTMTVQELLPGAFLNFQPN